MSLLKLDVLALRNIQHAQVIPSSTLNFIVGANGCGKSALLEAIFILGRARSFRTTQIKQAITFEKTQLVVSGQVRQTNDFLSNLGVQVDGKQTSIRVDQQSMQKADLAYAFPVQLIHPKSYRLIDGGPQLRREFLDWGIFNRNRNFLPYWRQFNKALQQRNALLKTQQRKQLPAWDKELLDYGERVNAFRCEYIDQLQPVFLKVANRFLPTSVVELRFDCGWDERRTLSDQFNFDIERDLRYGFTHSGPHRADFLMFHDNRLAKDFLSRGQQKLLVLALMLAQVDLMNLEQQNDCCILIDDLCAELDAENRAKLLEYLSQLSCQAFLTSNDLNDFGDLNGINGYKVFHVEQGAVKHIA